MKSMRVLMMMMIMLGFIRGDYSVSFAQVESNNISCRAKCVFECAPLISSPTLYQLCMRDCMKYCEDESTFAVVAVPDCNSSCGLINTGILFI